MKKNSEKESRNPQDELVESLNGIHLVDAGAGTGKTHTIISRYNKLLDSGVGPARILLITFTNVAASQMREDVIAKADAKNVSVTDLLEAPIMTFHALCTRILKKAGGDSPSYLGIADSLSPNFNVLEPGAFEEELFRKFFTVFRIRKGRLYEGILRTLENDILSVLSIIKKLCNAGIFPGRKGWLEDGLERLKGNAEVYCSLAKELNYNENGNQTEALKYLKDALKCPLDLEPENCVAGKRVNEDMLQELFEDENRNELIMFVRDVYVDYVSYLISRNQLTFDFIVMLAYIKLLTDDRFRNSIQYDYVMVDEFQDTDKIQFKLLLLLCREIKGEANLMVVGDWRQGIYGFRNTSIENITEFNSNLELHKARVNDGSEKISFSATGKDVKKITFEFNYRSSQEILDSSRNALFIKAVKGESASFEYEAANFRLPLAAKRNIGSDTGIEFLLSEKKEEEDEIRMIFEKIKELVTSDKYSVIEFDGAGNVSRKRRVRYSDIAVLSRTRDFCIKIQKDSPGYGVPMAFDGGLEIFASRQALVLLAWLKLLLNPKDPGAIAAILEYESFNFSQITRIVKSENIQLPAQISEFRSELMNFRNNIPYLIENVNGRYGFADEFAKSIMEEVDSWTRSDILSLGEIVSIMENSLLNHFDIELNKTYDSVTCRTIHSAKGLEYPVVILANVNARAFPGNRGSREAITFNDVAGIRLKKVYAQVNGYWDIFSNPRTAFVNKICSTSDYSESRRLLYVALTRAKQYLYITAHNPSLFFTELAAATSSEISKGYSFSGEISYAYTDDSEASEIPRPLPVEKKTQPVSVKKFVASFHEAEDNTNSLGNSIHGMEYGREVHLAAFKHAVGIAHKSVSLTEERIKKFIDGLGAVRLDAEVDFSLPKDGRLLRGTIDLIAHFNDRILVVDYKTDKSMERSQEYTGQVKIYVEAVTVLYPGKPVSGLIYFAGLDKTVEV